MASWVARAGVVGQRFWRSQGRQKGSLCDHAPARCRWSSWKGHTTPSPGSGVAAAAALAVVSAAIVTSRARQRTWKPSSCHGAVGVAADEAQPVPPEDRLLAGRDEHEKRAALFRAVNSGDMTRAEKLLPHLRYIDEPLTVTGETALGVACAAGYSGPVDTFLNLGADPRAMDAEGSTCLALACVGGHANVVDRLMADPRVDAAQADGFGLAPLHKATASGHQGVVEILLRYGSNADVVTLDSAKETSLHLLVKSVGLRKTRERERRRDVMRTLLRFNARVLVRDAEGNTPLHIAARRGDIWGLWLMLGSLEDSTRIIDIANGDGVTLLSEARSWGPDAEMTVWAAVVFNPLRQWWDRNWIVASFARNIIITIMVLLFFRRRFIAAGSPAC